MNTLKMYLGTKPQPAEPIKEGDCPNCQGGGCPLCSGIGKIAILNDYDYNIAISAYNQEIEKYMLNPFAMFFAKNLLDAKRIAEESNYINFAVIGESYFLGEDY